MIPLRGYKMTPLKNKVPVHVQFKPYLLDLISKHLQMEMTLPFCVSPILSCILKDIACVNGLHSSL